MKRSHGTAVVIVSAIALIALPAVEGGAVAPPPPSTVQQQWELLAAPESGVSSTRTITIARGTIGGTVMNPAPSISLEAVGRVQGATGGATWTVELRSATAVLGTAEFGASDTAFGIRSSTSPISWPAAATDLVSLRLVPRANGANLTGTFSLNKASLRFTQTGTIMATKGRVPLAPAQGINSTSFVDVADGVLYKHNLQGFDPAPTVRLRVTAQTTTYPLYANVRLVDSSGASVGGLEFWGTGSAVSLTSQPLTLQAGKTYRLQAQSAQANWQLYSADLELTQSTADPLGLASIVGWYTAAALPVTLTTNGQRANQPMKPTGNDVELTSVEWITVLKRIGSGSVSADLISPTSAPEDPLVSGVSTSSGAFDVTIRKAPPLPLGAEWWDTAAVVPSGATARLAASLLRMSLRLRDTITSLVASKTAFSPPQDAPYGTTDISGIIHPDAQSPTWHLSIVGEANEEVAHATGVGNSPAFTWDAAEADSGLILSDGTYTANLTIEDFPRVVRQLMISVDSSGPLIGRLSILPRDHGNTHFLSQPLMARITDATTGVDPASIDFTLIDETDQGARVETTHPSTSYDPVTGWAKTDPVSLQANHMYRIRVDASDLVGNFGTKAHRSVRDGGGFLAISTTPSVGSASIASTPCSVSSVDPVTQMRHVTCNSVPLVYGGTTLGLSAARRGSDGFVDHRVSLTSAVLQSTALGQPVSQPAYPAGTTHTEGLPFTVENPSWTAQTIPVAGKTAQLGPLTADVPGTWSTSVSVTMAQATTTASFSTCADPSASQAVVMCLPDPTWGLYEVLLDEGSNVQLIADAHGAEFGASILEVFDEGTPQLDQGYFAAMPYATAIAVAAELEVAEVGPKDRAWEEEDTVWHFEVRPPSGTTGGEAEFRCGWHDSCTGTVVPQLALDWSGFNGNDVDVRNSYFRALGWAYEEDATSGEISLRQAPETIGYLEVDASPSGLEDEQMVRAIRSGHGPASGEFLAGAFFQHVDQTTDTQEIGDLIAGQSWVDGPYDDDGYWGPPQLSRVRVGDDVAGQNHTHIDQMLSTDDPTQKFLEMSRNHKIPTGAECNEGMTCADTWSMRRPEDPPTQTQDDGGTMLTLDGERYERYPLFWWDWFENPCRIYRLCEFLDFLKDET